MDNLDKALYLWALAEKELQPTEETLAPGYVTRLFAFMRSYNVSIRKVGQNDNAVEVDEGLMSILPEEVLMTIQEIQVDSFDL